MIIKIKTYKGLLISKNRIKGNTRKRRDIDNRLGIFKANFWRFFLINKLIFTYKIILHSLEAYISVKLIKNCFNPIFCNLI